PTPCFARRYNAAHLARHGVQKVSGPRKFVPIVVGKRDSCSQRVSGLYAGQTTPIEKLRESGK
ncbi:MAG: hypothetical protein WCE27_19240, partial [Pseudolabrys sp.]